MSLVYWATTTSHSFSEREGINACQCIWYECNLSLQTKGGALVIMHWVSYEAHPGDPTNKMKTKLVTMLKEDFMVNVNNNLWKELIIRFAIISIIYKGHKPYN